MLKTIESKLNIALSIIILIIGLITVNIDPFDVFKTTREVSDPIITQPPITDTDLSVLFDGIDETVRSSILKIKIMGHSINTPLNIGVVGHGSAVIIGTRDDEYIGITNYHVLDDIVGDWIVDYYMAVDYFDNEYTIEKLTSQYLNYDLASFTIPNEVELYIPFIKDEYSVDMPIMSISYPAVIGYSVTHGNIKSIWDTHVLHSSKISGGSSGSGIFNTNGDLVGINYMSSYILEDDELIWKNGWAIRISILMEYLTHYELDSYIKEE